MIIAATDRKSSVLPFRDQISLIVAARPDMIMLTERDMSPDEYKETALFCAEECKKNNVKLCLDKFADVANEIGIRTIHLDADEIREAKFDTVLVTVHNEKEAKDAEASGASILIFREVFDMSCKSCRRAKGLPMLRFMLGAVDIPVVGAGGILPDVFGEVLATDAAGVCMKYGFMTTKDPSAVVKAYRDTETHFKR